MKATAMPRPVGQLPEKRHGNRGPNQVTLERARVLQAAPAKWHEWPTSAPPSQLRKTLLEAAKALRLAGVFEAEIRNGKSYARWTPPALPSGERPATELPALECVQDAKPSNGSTPATSTPVARSTRTPHVRAPRPPSAGTARSGRPGSETTSEYDDEGNLLRSDDGSGLAPFQPLLMPKSRERELADAPVSEAAYRPKVKCPTCKNYLVIEEKHSAESTLKQHYRDFPTCKTAQKTN